MCIPLNPILKEDTLPVKWATDRNWHTKLLDTWKVTQLNVDFIKKAVSHATDSSGYPEGRLVLLSHC